LGFILDGAGDFLAAFPVRIEERLDFAAQLRVAPASAVEESRLLLTGQVRGLEKDILDLLSRMRGHRHKSFPSAMPLRNSGKTRSSEESF
jgi:hypothetical protein